MKTKKDKIFTALRIIVSVSLFTFLIARNYRGLADVLPVLKEFNHYYLFLSVAFFIGGIAAMMLRWDILLRARNIYVHKGYLMLSYYVGYFYSNIFPTNLGGDIYRSYDLYKYKKINLQKNISIIIMERFISAAVGTFYIIISFFLVYKYLSLRLMLGFMLMPAVMLVFFLAILMPQKFKLNRLFKKFKFLKRMESKFNDFRDSFIKFKDKKKYIALSFAANMFSQFLFIVCYYFANLYAGINLNFLSFLFLNPIIILSANIPVSIGGIGVRENIAVLLLKQFGVAEADAVVFTLVILAIIILNAFIGGAVHILKNLFYKPGSKNS